MKGWPPPFLHSPKDPSPWMVGTKPSVVNFGAGGRGGGSATSQPICQALIKVLSFKFEFNIWLARVAPWPSCLSRQISYAHDCHLLYFYLWRLSEILIFGRHLILGQWIVCLHWLLLIWPTYLLVYSFDIFDLGKGQFPFTLLVSNFIFAQVSYPKDKTHLTNLIGFSIWVILI